MPSWDPGLPQSPLLDGAQGSFGQGGLRTQTETGPAKQRARFTSAPRPRSYKMACTKAQLILFESYWEGGMAYGAAVITDFPDPIHGPCKARFPADKPPSWEPDDSADEYIVTFQAELLPPFGP